MEAAYATGEQHSSHPKEGISTYALSENQPSTLHLTVPNVSFEVWYSIAWVFDRSTPQSFFKGMQGSSWF